MLVPYSPNLALPQLERSPAYQQAWLAQGAVRLAEVMPIALLSQGVSLAYLKSIARGSNCGVIKGTPEMPACFQPILTLREE